MFFRQKQSGGRVYLQIVENRWERGGSRQRVIATLGRLDRLRDEGRLGALLESGTRFCESVLLLGAHERGDVPVVRTQRIGPALESSGARAAPPGIVRAVVFWSSAAYGRSWDCRRFSTVC